jgi:hypothetical protein
MSPYLCKTAIVSIMGFQGDDEDHGEVDGLPFDRACIAVCGILEDRAEGRKKVVVLRELHRAIIYTTG